MWTGANDEGGVEGAKVALHCGTFQLSFSSKPGAGRRVWYHSCRTARIGPGQRYSRISRKTIYPTSPMPAIKSHALNHLSWRSMRSGVKKGSRGTDRMPEDCHKQLEAFLIIGVDFHDAMPRLQKLAAEPNEPVLKASSRGHGTARCLSR
jgi:hypothetical protein